MILTRLFALLAGLSGGYALALWMGLCAPDGGCLTWSVLTTTGGVGVLVQQAAGLLLDA